MGNVNMQMYMQYRSSCNANLTYFPFDMQVKLAYLYNNVETCNFF